MWRGFPGTGGRTNIAVYQGKDSPGESFDLPSGQEMLLPDSGVTF